MNKPNILDGIIVLQVAPDSTAPNTLTLAAGTTDVNSANVDLATYQGMGIAFVVGLGTILAGGGATFKVQHSDDGVAFADIPGATITVADDKDATLTAIQVNRVTRRYARLVTDRLPGANSDLRFIHAYVGELRTQAAQPVGVNAWAAQPVIVGGAADSTAV